MAARPAESWAQVVGPLPLVHTQTCLKTQKKEVITAVSGGRPNTHQELPCNSSTNAFALAFSGGFGNGLLLWWL